MFQIAFSMHQFLNGLVLAHANSAARTFDPLWPYGPYLEPTKLDPTDPDDDLRLLDNALFDEHLKLAKFYEETFKPLPKECPSFSPDKRLTLQALDNKLAIKLRQCTDGEPNEGPNEGYREENDIDRRFGMEVPTRKELIRESC